MKSDSNIPKYLDRSLQGSLFLLVLAAPMSIAVTQIAWSFALLCWIVKAFLVRPTLRKGGIDIAILAFVGLTVLSSVFSYEQEVSLKKLISVSLVTIVYLVSEYVQGTSMLRKIVTVLVVSSTFTAVFAVGNFLVGRNLKVTQLTAESPLRSAVCRERAGGIQENDTILKVNGIGVSNPDNLLSVVPQTSDGIVRIDVYRVENVLKLELPVATLLGSEDNSAKLGIVEWSRGRDVRAAAFYGHYTTFAEALQLLLSLALGFLIVAPGSIFSRNRLFLAVTVGVSCIALFLTLTRASWAGFAISAAAMVLIGTGRKTVLICVAIAIPLAAVGLFYLQQKRNVAFIDTSDNSTTWRMTVWQEGFDLLISNPRHLAVGVGMDSLKNHWQEWHLFDEGKLPIGHMHSTPLQFALERGIPTLIAWIAWMLIYLRMLWRGFRRKNAQWQERGIFLGAIGGTLGFLSSGLVHYNWGDSEVAMVFYIIMGLSLAALRTIEEPQAEIAT
ncbi:hypothetical protein BH10ACI2_BH10ACI2_24210 [soil metagenome]